MFEFPLPISRRRKVIQILKTVWKGMVDFYFGLVPFLKQGETFHRIGLFLGFSSAVIAVMILVVIVGWWLSTPIDGIPSPKDIEQGDG